MKWSVPSSRQYYLQTLLIDILSLLPHLIAAERPLGRLDGITVQSRGKSYFYICMCVKSALSSQIAHTQSTLSWDLLRFETEPPPASRGRLFARCRITSMHRCMARTIWAEILTFATPYP